MGSSPPEQLDDGLVHYNRQCVSVGCYPEIDGETTFILGRATEMGRESVVPVFDGTIETPTRRLVICTVLGTILLEAEVPDQSTRVRVWANHLQWPTEVIVGWG